MSPNLRSKEYWNSNNNQIFQTTIWYVMFDFHGTIHVTSWENEPLQRTLY